MESKLDFLPNAFYDLIVFTSSTVTFGVVIAIGVGWTNLAQIQHVGIVDATLLGIIILIVGYEYGRIAEAWSALVVQSPLRFLSKHKIGFGDPMFLAEPTGVDAAFDLPTFAESRNGGKWAVYYYATVVNPRLGSDLLKRYAWEKLARNSAFNNALILVASFVAAGLRFAHVALPFGGAWTFGGLGFTCAVAVAVGVTYFEYYQRNCWNMDLLRRVMPVLRRAEDIHADKAASG
jgi:hypothetical protein